MTDLMKNTSVPVCITVLLLLVKPLTGAQGAKSDGKSVSNHRVRLLRSANLLATPGLSDHGQGSERVLTLEDLERMALELNPTLAQAAADIRAAEGRKIQVGLYPNPTVGYAGEEVSFGPVIRGGEHGFLIRQEIVTAGKLGLNRKVLAKEQVQLEAEAKVQQLRVLNAVRLLYYQALGAEEGVELRSVQARIAREAVNTSHQLFNVGQADQPDVLEAEIEAQRAEIGLLAARTDHARIWQQLASVVGDPSLKPVPLAGELGDSLPDLEQEVSLEAILRDSPELRVAEAGVERAELALKRARVEVIPNIQVTGGLRYNRELLELGGRPVGREGVLSVAVQLPIFNRNQGNVWAAQAQLVRAQQEVQRVKLALRSRFAAAFREYSDYLVQAQRYESEILPRARQAFEQYKTRFREMAAAYPQVLIAQRNLFQSQESYVRTLVNLWQSAVTIRGLLLVDGLGMAAFRGEPKIFSAWGEVAPPGGALPETLVD